MSYGKRPRATKDELNLLAKKLGVRFRQNQSRYYFDGRPKGLTLSQAVKTLRNKARTSESRKLIEEWLEKLRQTKVVQRGQAYKTVGGELIPQEVVNELLCVPFLLAKANEPQTYTVRSEYQMVAKRKQTVAEHKAKDTEEFSWADEAAEKIKNASATDAGICFAELAQEFVNRKTMNHWK